MYFVVDRHGVQLSQHRLIERALPASRKAGDDAKVTDSNGIIYAITMHAIGGAARVQKAEKSNTAIRVQLANRD